MFKATNSELIYYAADFQLHWANGICYSVKWAFPSEHLVSLDHLTKVWENEVCKHSTAMPAASLFCPLNANSSYRLWVHRYCTPCRRCEDFILLKAKEKVQKMSQISWENTFPSVFRVKNWNNLPCTYSVDDGFLRSQLALCEMADVNRTVCN